MSGTQPVSGLLRVPDWPRITATVATNGTGTITVNGTERACAAESVPALRTGIIARAVSVAGRLRRPVRLDVTENGQTHALAVRPEGHVQLVDAAGTIPPADGLTLDEGRCRICRRLQPVTSATCLQCGVNDPLRVETTPAQPDVFTPLQLEPERSTPAEQVDADESGSSTNAPLPASEPESDVDELPSAGVDCMRLRSTFREVGSGPTLRLTLNTQESITTQAGIAVGRDPESVGGRVAIPLVSPGRLMSRTHATIDIDDDYRVVITDLHSSNGIELLTDPPHHLAAGEPTVIPDGATILLGDVYCTVAIA